MEIKPRDPKKKCIAKKCEECHQFRPWNFEKLDDKGNPTGLKELVTACSLDVLYDTIPRIVGSFDGCQQATNETQNAVNRFAEAAVKSFKVIAQNAPKLLK